MKKLALPILLILSALTITGCNQASDQFELKETMGAPAPVVVQEAQTYINGDVD